MISVLLAAVLTAATAIVAGALTYFAMAGKTRVLEAQLAAQSQNSVEKMEMLQAAMDTARGQLAEKFTALSADALAQNNAQFLTLAKENLQQFQQKAELDLQQRQNDISHVVKPVADTLSKMELKIGDLEAARQNSYTELKTLVGTMATDQQRLQHETASLVQALRAPTTRGRWGEMQLKRVLDMAGLQENLHYQTQVSQAMKDGAKRPDVVVNLPPDRVLLIDAKVPMESYLNSWGDQISDAERRVLWAKHTQDFKGHIDGLSKKDYTSAFPSYDWVVLFVPLDSLMQIAMEHEPALMEYAWNKKVVIVTPTSLLGMLRIVAHAHDQFKVNESAKDIAKLGETLYKNVTTFMGHMAAMGKSLNGALDKYNAAVGSLDSRVMPALRQMRDKGIAVKEALPDLHPVEERSRVLTAREALAQIALVETVAEAVADTLDGGASDPMVEKIAAE